MPDIARQYSDYLHTAEDGQVWWRLADAIKLVAGFRPIETVSGPALQPTSNRARGIERGLVGAVRKEHGLVKPPPTLSRDQEEMVAARAFLNWYAGYLLETQSNESLPSKLAQAVSDAEAAARQQPQYQSLTGMLKGRWDFSMAAMPEVLAVLIEKAAPVIPWDALSVEQRQAWASQHDSQNDPVNEGENQYWWALVVRKHELLAEIREWERAGTPTALDKVTKEQRLESLKKELKANELKFRAPASITQPPDRGRRAALQGAPKSQREADLIPYPQALAILQRRFDATPIDLAGWLFFGPEEGGLRAFLNANELGDQRIFAFVDRGEEQPDFLGPLMATWFRAADLHAFSPKERFLSAVELVSRWSTFPGIDVRGFIRAKVMESRLQDFHPVVGLTQWTFPGDSKYPPEDQALFCLSEVKAIEEADFPKALPEAQRRPRSGKRNVKLQTDAEALVAKLRTKGKRVDISKREIAVLLSQSPEWQDMKATSIERVLVVTW